MNVQNRITESLLQINKETVMRKTLEFIKESLRGRTCIEFMYRKIPYTKKLRFKMNRRGEENAI